MSALTQLLAAAGIQAEALHTGPGALALATTLP
jgi:hypothetical protein